MIIILSEGHLSYYTTVRGPDVLRNVIGLGYLTFIQINKFFVNNFFTIDKMSPRAGWNGFGDPCHRPIARSKSSILCSVKMPLYRVRKDVHGGKPRATNRSITHQSNNSAM